MLLCQVGKRLDAVVCEYVFGEDRQYYTTLQHLDSTDLRAELSEEHHSRWQLVRAFIVISGHKMMLVKKGQRLVEQQLRGVAKYSDAELHAISQEQLSVYRVVSAR
jgi:hypothetical protein